jgi:hypothetical protein
MCDVPVLAMPRRVGRDRRATTPWIAAPFVVDRAGTHGAPRRDRRSEYATRFVNRSAVVETDPARRGHCEAASRDS